MKTLYVSTDSREVQELLGISSEYSFRNYSIEEGEKLISKVGFNPMSKISINTNQNVGNMVSRLLENDLFVAIENEQEISMQKPKDYDLKTKLLQVSDSKGYPFADFVFKYSLNPNKIDREYGIPKRTDNWMNPWTISF